MSVAELALALDGSPSVPSSLNASGIPLQYCCTWDAAGPRLRVLADPASDCTDPAARVARSRRALGELFARAQAGALLPLAQRLFDASTHDLAAVRDGVCWLAAALDAPGAALY
ncbi:MAG TPA: hypothetical protein VMH02_05185, partial [Verrucomicrobiae bacterium]|nr:hypothetical protein [Verrucomicrobiae bacterium]